jgi:CRP-like cAMP-binding protein
MPPQRSKPGPTWTASAWQRRLPASVGLECLQELGRVRLLRRGTVVVPRGAPLTTVFIVLAGRLAVQRAGRAERDADSVYPGEIVVDALATAMPPSAITLVAVRDACVLAVSRARLDAKLGDPVFAAKFYRALALVLACSAERRVAQRTVRGHAGVPTVAEAAPSPGRGGHDRHGGHAA